MDPSRLAEILADWGYATYLFLLAVTGVGSPIPEDLILATAGYLIAAKIFTWPAAYAAGVVGVIGSDALLYTWGRRLRSGANEGWMSRFVRPHHLATADRWLTRFGDRAVFFARLVPGTRAVTFLGAGLRQMPFGRFLLYDAAGALLWVPIVLFAGAQIGEEIGGLEQLGATIGRFMAWIVGGLVVLMLLWRWWRVEESKL